ncbi:sporulation protein YpjB [Bacillus carboniphilus]|uniref:Sporulation protein YpjB n=1 Tax=Bacillus carboniphilus TaxID=86663 RepID=A0ABY9JWF4_9BACI|nr:sporulation protein YpjB [Bacillus carboniphilus]WLR43721.1 sporulation protein YpjB [Bacillus carboniphilus]
MKRALFLVFAIMLITFQGQAQSNSWDSLDDTVDSAWQLAKQERFKEATQLLLYFEKQLNDIPVTTERTVDDVYILTTTYQNALDAMRSNSISNDEKVRAITKLRLVSDAFFYDENPMWRAMEDELMLRMTHLMTSIENGDQELFNNHWSHFLDQYRLVYPSLMMDVQAIEVNRIDTQVSSVESSAFHKMSTQTKLNHLSVMEEDLKRMFKAVEEDEADPSLVWVIITTGGIIVLSLLYTGWRKYQGEKLEKKRKVKKER